VKVLGNDSVRGCGARTYRPVCWVGVIVVLAAGLVACGSENDQATTAALDPKVVRAGTLTVCTSFPYRPFEFKKAGEPAGFDIDLANEVAKELGLEPKIVNADFDDIQSGQLLNEGKCDVAIAGLTITGERARVLDFSSPYFDAAQAMVVRQGSGFSSLDDLGGAKIGVQESTTGELYVTDNAPSDAEIVAFPDASDVDDALNQGEVDAGIYDNTVVGGVVSRNPDFMVADQFDTEEQYGMAVKKNGSVDLLRFINNVLAELKANGGYDQIYEQWFGSA
jgi:polar amino acid transport system substrate-binding protein